MSADGPVMIHHDVDSGSMPDCPELELLNCLADLVGRYADKLTPQRRRAVVRMLAELEGDT